MLASVLGRKSSFALSGDRHSPRFCGMDELSMAACCIDELPAVVVKQTQDLTDLHAVDAAAEGRTRLCRLREGTQAQNSAATERNTAAQRSTSPTETHSTFACAPSPPGPNSTVGIRISAIRAESAQKLSPTGSPAPAYERTSRTISSP